jgi:hypothetical protein
MRSKRARAAALVGLVAVALVMVSRRGAGVLDPPPPAPRSDVLPSEAPSSTLSLPLALPLSVLVELLEEAVPTTHGTQDSLLALPDRGRTAVTIALEREPFRASLVDDVARVATTLRYALRLSYDLPALPDPGGSCGFDGDRRPGLAVEIRSPVSLARDWTLRTRAQVVDVRPASDSAVDRCEVTVLGLDLTDRVVEGARGFLEDHLDDIDRRAARVDTRSHFERWWDILQEPIELSDSLWLAMGPQTIMRGPVSGTGDSVRVALALRASPRILLGPRPTPLPSTLPELDSGSIEPRLDLRVDGRADYHVGSQFLMDRLVGRELEFGGSTLRLHSVRVYGVGGGTLALEVGVSGDLRGRLYLTGTPTIDAATSRISVPDLDFDVATEEAVFGIVPALVALSLRDYLREQASWPVDPAVQWLADWLGRGLNRDLSRDLRVVGAVDTVQIVGVYALRDVLLVRMAAQGSASLIVVQ